MIVNSEEELQKFVAKLDDAVNKGEITKEQRLYSLFELARDHAEYLLRQTEEIDRILMANAIADAKNKVLEISEKYLFSPYNKVAVAVPQQNGEYKCEIREA
jgi:hypothetical protein